MYGNTSAPIHRPTVHYRTPGEHLCPIPSPNSTAPHARGTFLPLSVAQRCITARSGNIYAPFRRLTAPRRTPGEHFGPVPSPNSTTTHAQGTLPPVSVAQGCRGARSGDTYAQFRRRGGRGKGNGRGGRSMGDGREAGLGRGQEKARARGRERGRERAQIE